MKVALLFAFVVAGVICEDPPKWYPQHQVSGVIELPYAEIEEPFTAYFDATGSRSRIDYYGDSVKTYQFAKETEFGRQFKLTWMSALNKTGQFTARTCFQINGTKDAPTSVQAGLPDLTHFVQSGYDTLDGQKAESWTFIQKNENKVNRYIMWVKFPADKFGITLFGSHYDRYYITYTNYESLSVNGTDINAIFKVPNATKCHGFPGPGVEHRVMSNPMNEFINMDASHVSPMFEEFKKAHGKKYANASEHTIRKALFHQNLRFVHATNRKPLTYKVAINHLADLTNSERKVLRGYKPSKGYNGGLPQNMHEVQETATPDIFDWRYYGAVTPVKDQAICGSCWSFGTVGCLEGAHFLKTGQLVRLSEQELVDCSWGQGNNACDGGEDFRAYQWIMMNGGIATDASYGSGSYMGQDGKCVSKNVTVGATMQSYVNVTHYDPQALKSAMVLHGPVSVAIDAAVKSFSFYSHGVYYDPACKHGPDDLDHAVLAVGFGTLQGQPYWLIKNSWSTYWGNDGYILISQRDNNCGVMTSPTYVNM